MTEFDEESGAARDGAERLAGLSPREAQDALAEELSELSAAPHSDDAGDEDPAGDEPDADAAEAVADPVWSAAAEAEHLKMLEALLFASPEPLDKAAIARRLPAGADIAALIETLKAQYENRGVVLSAAGGRFRFVTSPDVAHILTEEKVETRKLSRAAMETLAIIAYHQPCTRADIEDVRGVAVSKGSIDQLLEIGWVRLAGRRKTAPGRPVLYATTKGFLEHFDLGSVGELPGMADLKAAGLLEANLPPDFSVPVPRDAGEDSEDDEEIEDADAAEFVQDFHAAAVESGPGDDT